MREKYPAGKPAFFTASTTAAPRSSEVTGCFDDAFTTTGQPSRKGSTRSGPTTPIPQGKLLDGKFTATPRATRIDRTLIDPSSATEMDGATRLRRSAPSA